MERRSCNDFSTSFKWEILLKFFSFKEMNKVSNLETKITIQKRQKLMVNAIILIVATNNDNNEIK